MKLHNFRVVIIAIFLAANAPSIRAEDRNVIDPEHVAAVRDVFLLSPETGYTVRCYIDGLSETLSILGKNSKDEREFTASLLFSAGVSGLASRVIEGCDARNPNPENLSKPRVRLFRHLYWKNSLVRDRNAAARCLSFHGDPLWAPLQERCKELANFAEDALK